MKNTVRITLALLLVAATLLSFTACGVKVEGDWTATISFKDLYVASLEEDADADESVDALCEGLTLTATLSLSEGSYLMAIDEASFKEAYATMSLRAVNLMLGAEDINDTDNAAKLIEEYLGMTKDEFLEQSMEEMDSSELNEKGTYEFKDNVLTLTPEKVDEDHEVSTCEYKDGKLITDLEGINVEFTKK